YGETIQDLRGLAEMLVERDDFDNNACRLAFAFVFGREEEGTEPATFAGCLEVFRATGDIRDAVRHYLESDLFCPAR
ncbi:MAG: hypothetical protein AAFZ18_30075, partial [Myxococcota bacterium]